jgi:hypothetical protein
MAFAWECVEAARRRGLTTNSASGRYLAHRCRSNHDVAALSLFVLSSAGAFPEREHERSRNERVFGRGHRSASARLATMCRQPRHVATVCLDRCASDCRPHKLWSRCHEVLAGPYARCCSGGCVHENRTTGGFRTAAIIWRTAGVAAARNTTARGDITGTSGRECKSSNSTAKVRGTGEACAVVTRHLGFNRGRAAAVGSARSAEACGTTAASVSHRHCSRRHIARRIGAEQSRIEDESGRGCGQRSPGEAAGDRRHYGCPARR